MLLGFAVGACTSSSKGTSTRGGSTAAAATPSTVTTATSTPPKKDRDDDLDNNDDDEYVLLFGHPAEAADNRAIATTIHRYFAAAAAEDGAKACSMLTPFVAEAVVEQDRHTALEGKTCASVMSKLFKLDHRELLDKSAHLKVMRIGIEGDRSRVALEFPEIPVIRQITMRRQGGRWTVLDQLDHLIE